MAALTAGARGEPVDAEPVIRAVGATLQSNALDPAFKAEAILVPSDTLIAERMEVVDPDAIHASREALRAAIGTALSGELLAAHRSDGVEGDDLSPRAKGIRRLRTVALGLLVGGGRGAGGGARQDAVRRRRQHDRPPGRARHPRVDARRRAAGGARRFLRALPRRSAGARQMVCAPGRGAAAGHASTRC